VKKKYIIITIGHHQTDILTKSDYSFFMNKQFMSVVFSYTFFYTTVAPVIWNVINTRKQLTIDLLYAYR
jgi:hypothetical protein